MGDGARPRSPIHAEPAIVLSIEHWISSRHPSSTKTIRAFRDRRRRVIRHIQHQSSELPCTTGFFPGPSAGARGSAGDVGQARCPLAFWVPGPSASIWKFQKAAKEMVHRVRSAGRRPSKLACCGYCKQIASLPAEPAGPATAVMIVERGN